MSLLVNVRASDLTFRLCLMHSLSTETTEVMGLLLGEMVTERGDDIINIYTVFVSKRSRIAKDRVEIAPEDLVNAVTRAEEISKKMGRPVRVIGWYHSHPHITVHPSQIDIGTQKSFQENMEPRFVGLIISCFNRDKPTEADSVKITCFQATTTGLEEVAQPLQIVDKCRWVPDIDHKKSLLVETWLTENGPLEALQIIKAMVQEEEFNLDGVEGTNSNFLTKMHNDAVYKHNICNILQVFVAPLIASLEHRLKVNRAKLSLM
eukprot:CFRG1637T1